MACQHISLHRWRSCHVFLIQLEEITTIPECSQETEFKKSSMRYITRLWRRWQQSQSPLSLIKVVVREIYLCACEYHSCVIENEHKKCDEVVYDRFSSSFSFISFHLNKKKNMGSRRGEGGSDKVGKIFLEFFLFRPKLIFVDKSGRGKKLMNNYEFVKNHVDRQEMWILGHKWANEVTFRCLLWGFVKFVGYFEI